jgi:hypothetical protein
MKKNIHNKRIGLKYIYSILTVLIFYSCNWTSVESDLKEEVHRTTNYDDGVVREGLYKNNIPIDRHKFYKQNTLKKVINYIEWDEEYVEFLNKNSESYDIFKIDSSKLFGHPNNEFFVSETNELDTSKSSFITYYVISDTSVRIKANISRFNQRANKWVHLFLFKDSDVRYIVEDTFDFIIDFTKNDVQMIKEGNYKFYSMIAVEDDKLSYTHMKLINMSEIDKLFERIRNGEFAK